MGCFKNKFKNKGDYKCFSPLAGCGLFHADPKTFLATKAAFQSPCGVWVVSENEKDILIEDNVSVPLRGVSCFSL